MKWWRLGIKSLLAQAVSSSTFFSDSVPKKCTDKSLFLWQRVG